MPGTHVLLDYENVQPTEEELRTMVPDATQVWVFHGPHQRQVEQRFASFGTKATAVPISKTGKDALDFHLSFYMGYIASRNQAAAMVVVANDKGYGPVLEHARAMGFDVRQVGHGRAKLVSTVRATPAEEPAVKPVPAKKAVVKKAVAPAPTVKKATAKKAPAQKVAPAKKVVAKPTNALVAKKTPVATPPIASKLPVATGLARSP
ncbi:PIN domain-containing protein [Aquabacterium sp.]|uniref:PIN domain-containing protein n=1 Tax=Aquabacterium sp. TaxID=1872578 RepID=UPI002D804DD0|nr:PIN domain-containing protein [Aquabacterium sp.]